MQIITRAVRPYRMGKGYGGVRRVVERVYRNIPGGRPTALAGSVLLLPGLAPRPKITRLT